jgi:hypothetical protein
MPTPIEISSDLAGRTSATPVVIKIPGSPATVGLYNSGLNDDDALAAAIATSTILDDIELTSRQHAASFRLATHEAGLERTLTLGAGSRAGPSSRELELERQLEEAQLEIKRLRLEGPVQPHGNANRGSSNCESGQTGGEPRVSYKAKANEESVEEPWNPFGYPMPDPPILHDGSLDYGTRGSHKVQTNEESVEESWNPFGYPVPDPSMPDEGQSFNSFDTPDAVAQSLSVAMWQDANEDMSKEDAIDRAVAAQTSCFSSAPEQGTAPAFEG